MKLVTIKYLFVTEEGERKSFIGSCSSAITDHSFGPFCSMRNKIK
jgi:hypothetical protein